MVSFREKPQPNLETFSSLFSQNRPAELARFLTRILSIDGKILGSTKKKRHDSWDLLGPKRFI